MGRAAQEQAVGVDAGATLLKLVLRAADGSEQRHLLPGREVAAAVELASGADPSRLGITGGGAEGFTRRWIEAHPRQARSPEARRCEEFESWAAGARSLIEAGRIDSSFPFLLASVGTGTSVLLVNSDSVHRVGGTALGGGTTEKQIYLSTLENLSWGELFFPYQVRIDLTHPMMAAKQFPMTFEEIGSGLVKGPQRIVTMNSGVYGWANSTELHQIHKFDARGAPATHDFLTTVDSKSVRSELNFAEQESAVIEPIPVTLDAANPVNARVLAYDVQKLKLLLHGKGQAELSMFVGASHVPKRTQAARDIAVGAPYRVSVGDQVRTIHERDGTVTVPLVLTGQTQVTVEPVATSE